MLTKLKKKVQQTLTSQATAAHKIGLTPNKVSAIGFILAFTAAGAYGLSLTFGVVSSHYWLLMVATVLLLASGFCDTLDGIIARTFQQVTVFGGFFDSVLDRYADAAVYRRHNYSGAMQSCLGYHLGFFLGISSFSRLCTCQLYQSKS